jgi:CubicO group peptidase (beta-lactamase class C family)
MFAASRFHPAQCQSAQTIDSLIETKRKESGIVGMGAAIIVHKKIAWIKGFGFADQENKIPFTASSILNIGSISKTFTGFCLMKAVEEKKLSLDENINTYLPFKIVNPYFPEEKITLRQLATHTSGLADRYPFYTDSTYCYNGIKPEPLGDFLKNYFTREGSHYSKENFLNKKPGSYRDYSNIGAALAGYIVEQRTGKKLNELGRQIIFEPLKMQNSGWLLDEIDLARHSKLYQQKGDSMLNIPLYEGITYPDGGVRTSVEDLSKFFIMLLNDGNYEGKQLLTRKAAKEMLRFQFSNNNKPENVDDITKLNSGIFWSTKMGGRRIGHNGSDPGIRTFMLCDLNREIAVIVFFNTELDETKDARYVDIYETLYQYGLTLKNSKKLSVLAGGFYIDKLYKSFRRNWDAFYYSLYLPRAVTGLVF